MTSRKKRSWGDFIPENILAQQRNPFVETDICSHKRRSLTSDNDTVVSKCRKSNEFTKIASSSALFVTSPNHQNSSP